jgi:hypothetical protein
VVAAVTLIWPGVMSVGVAAFGANARTAGSVIAALEIMTATPGAARAPPSRSPPSSDSIALDCGFDATGRGRVLSDPSSATHDLSRSRWLNSRGLDDPLADILTTFRVDPNLLRRSPTRSERE